MTPPPPQHGRRRRLPDPNTALDDVLFAGVARTKRNRTPVRYDVTKDVLPLTYRTPDCAIRDGWGQDLDGHDE
jgi:hypothetical protein